MHHSCYESQAFYSVVAAFVYINFHFFVSRRNIRNEKQQSKTGKLPIVAPSSDVCDDCLSFIERRVDVVR